MTAFSHVASPRDAEAAVMIAGYVLVLESFANSLFIVFLAPIFELIFIFLAFEVKRLS